MHFKKIILLDFLNTGIGNWTLGCCELQGIQWSANLTVKYASLCIYLLRQGN